MGGAWLSEQSFKLNVINAWAQRIRSDVHFDYLPFNFVSLQSYIEIFLWVNYKAPLLYPISVLATFVRHSLSNLTMLRVNYLAGFYIKDYYPKRVETKDHFLFDHFDMPDRFISTGIELDNPLVETSIGHRYSKGIWEAKRRGHQVSIISCTSNDKLSY